MPLILPARTLDSGYEIDNSLRFNDDDDPSLSRTPSSASNRKTWTWSGWVKRGNLSIDIMLLSAGSSGQGVYLNSGNQFQLTKNGVGNYGSTALLRDVSAWYHLVVACDTTQTGMANIAKFYINGTEQSTSGTTIYSTNEDTNINDDVVHYISRWSGSSAENHHDGYLADVNFIDGLRLDASYFGETNDNGVWIPKEYTGSYGTNGFFLEFQQTGTSQNSSGIGADTSGNDNHYAVTNLAATDVTVDTPTNNFCTFNPLDNDTVTGAASFSEGNLVINANSDAQSGCPSTIAVSNGAWYIEGKCLSSTFEMGMFGYGDGFSFNLANHPPYGDNGYPFAYEYGGKLKINNIDSQTGLATFTTNDILAIALDMDNNTIKFFKNGSQVGTTITDSNLSTFAPYTFYIANHTGSNTNMFSLNTGNPAYTISSGNSDANGYGNFEYAVPSGYYSLCTKNLAEYG